MPDLHTEIEYKFEADAVDIKTFLLWAFSKCPTQYETDTCPDVYYVRGKDSIRHRWTGGYAGELTVKRRTSKKDLTSREEIDLFFDTVKTTIGDVGKFLCATGWERAFTLFKDAVHVFAFDAPKGGRVFVSIYEVEKFNEKTRKYSGRRRFIEVEIEKGSSYDEFESKAILDTWKSYVQLELGVQEPMNKSLFEIYSGKATRLKSSAT